MYRHKQRYRHRPDEGEFGDCDRTVIACLLEVGVDEVPHWGVHYADRVAFFKMKKEFLEGRGLYEHSVAFECSWDELKENLKGIFRDVYVMVTGTSRNNCHHVVITRNGEIVHDTSLDDSGIVGPCDDGYWHVSILLPLCLVRD